MPKLLGEFLKDQQEPFTLEVYLLERGYKRANATSSARFLKLLNKKRNAVVSDFLKAVFGKNGGQESTRNEEKDVVEENKQLSPVSVLQETESDHEEGSPLYHTEQCNPMKTQEKLSGTSTSPSYLKPPTCYRFEEKLADSYTQYIINKRIIRQSKQLLIDCTKEVIENHSRKDRNKEHLNKILGADALWKSVCENVWLWSQDSIDETNTILLIHSDFLTSGEEWSNDSKKQSREIFMDIGDAILAEIIHEIVIN